MASDGSTGHRSSGSVSLTRQLSAPLAAQAYDVGHGDRGQGPARAAAMIRSCSGSASSSASHHQRVKTA
ncbi:hypothetical protein [Streptomyces hygroscopicus]|uniref:hypothetical protein n=1 Tax=Streptomyces hygroscopicus TaxID=1912 RepID=UPI000825F004